MKARAWEEGHLRHTLRQHILLLVDGQDVEQPLSVKGPVGSVRLQHAVVEEVAAGGGVSVREGREGGGRA